MKTVLIASGTSQNKLNFAINFIETYLKERNVMANVLGANIYEVVLSDINPTVIVAIGPHTFDDHQAVVNGTAFITKMGMEQCCEEIIKYLGDS